MGDDGTPHTPYADVNALLERLLAGGAGGAARERAGRTACPVQHRSPDHRRERVSGGGVKRSAVGRAQLTLDAASGEDEEEDVNYHKQDGKAYQEADRARDNIGGVCVAQNRRQLRDQKPTDLGAREREGISPDEQRQREGEPGGEIGMEIHWMPHTSAPPNSEYDGTEGHIGEQGKQDCAL